MSPERRKLAQVFDALEDDRRALADELAALSDEQLAFSPYPGVWTVHQLFCHMALVEQLLLYHRAAKETAPQDEDGQDAAPLKTPTRRLRDRVMFFFMRLFFAVGIPVKAPIDAVVPPEEPPPVALLDERWTEMRRVVRAWIDGMDDERLHEPILRHAFARVDVFQALAFCRWHFDRHRKQIAARRKEPGFPG